ncbi:unnamed protein product [Angiostrongylus costaricensis]|uniref:Reverse transcriptase domain-containing protein n=1 Tax=Angiostrongylus costaricensis TaxID=334426 RepID=A0A0R3PNK6_ANGCS|nr:unnamed protein product [Angiostrongylus costaricensis]
MPAHLTNTQMFLDRLRNARPNSAYVVESFDVTALYTNVSNDSAIQAINELLIQHEGAIRLLVTVDDTLKGVPKLLNLQMVREVLRTNERAGNGTTTGTKPCYCIHV